MPIVGTAGHVDHGKSTLVLALTGRDPDRWAEEKRRGLTIDLGFAWATLGDRDVGFVDVPGHEKFMKNMLAGVGGLDAALFVVAADEGWMPQSEEHLAVLEILGVDRGVVAVTRVDLVDDDTLELAQLEIEDEVAGTVLEGWPIVPVSAVEGRGLEDVTKALTTALDLAGPTPNNGRPRLWIDRSFTIAGAGLVVTGTLVDGAIARGDRLELWPGPIEVRARSIQSHERDVDVAHPGSRTAINLSGAAAGVARGAMLSAPGAFRATDRVLVALRPTRATPEITDRGAYHLHAGTAASPCRLRLLDESKAVITLDAPLPLVSGDPFILRETGRRAVVGGGRVLDPAPTRRPNPTQARTLETAASSGADAVAAALLEVHGILDQGDLAAHTGGGLVPAALHAGQLVLSSAAVDRIRATVIETAGSYHDENPLRQGIPKAELASRVGADQSTIEAVLATTTAVIDDGSTVRLSEFGARRSAIQQKAWDDAQRELSSSLAVPRASQLGLDDELLHALTREGELIRIEADLVYLPAQIKQITARLDVLPEEFTVAEFRDELELARRQAVPLLEWLDGQGWTRRRGDVRVVRRRNGPSAADARPR